MESLIKAINPTALRPPNLSVKGGGSPVHSPFTTLDVSRSADQAHPLVVVHLMHGRRTHDGCARTETVH